MVELKGCCKKARRYPQPSWQDISVTAVSDVALARQRAHAMAEELGFSEKRCAEVVLAVSELAQNHVNCHTSDGRIVLDGFWCGSVAVLNVFSVDQGPGIRDVNKALVDGVTATGSYGNGLGTVKRLADDFAICSGRFGSMPCPERAGAETLVAASFWYPSSLYFMYGKMRMASLMAPLAGQRACGDGLHIISDGGVARIVLMDVLGHGDEAAVSVEKASLMLDFLAPDQELEYVIQMLDRLLFPMRGMAAMLVKIDLEHNLFQACGVGNICAFLHDSKKIIPVTSPAGVIGQHFNTARLLETEAVLRPGSSFVMCSDGISAYIMQECFQCGEPPLFSAWVGFNMAMSNNDDASLLVLEWLKP